MAIKEKNGNTFPHELFKIGELVTFQWDDTLKDGIVLVVDAYGTFESPNILRFNRTFMELKCNIEACAIV